MDDAETRKIRALDTEECWQRLTDHPVKLGRLGTGGPSPDILPVNYLVDGETLVFRTAPGKKLDAVARGERVVFEVDDVSPGWGRGWSVVLRGFAEHVTDADERRRLDDLPLVAWDPTPKSEHVRIISQLISGREIA